MEKLLTALPADGSWITFNQFKTNCAAVGARPEAWQKARRQGLVETRLPEGYTSADQLEIRKVV